ncbi:MAG: SH3 domain-containing protein, partial [Chloroflexi bacterium]|nr:SH3 domain-containing protein [Chloroflexota bacterium]
FLTEHEGIPVMLQGNIDACLRLCADYGIDEENDAEARDYLEHITNGGSYEKHKDDPVNAAWVKAHEAYDPALGDKNNDKAEIVEYRRQIETAYGVTFSSVEGADDWDLLRVRMVHVGMEMAAAALGERARQMGLDWDNATAFRRIIGEIDIHLSRDTSEEGALAQVENRRIKIFWVERDDGDRNAYLVPDVLLHELGHIFNANAGLGDREGQGSINKTKEHPNTWKGMGSPYPATLARENKPDRSVKFESWMEDIRPLHDILGLRAGDKLFSGVTLTKDQILLLRHSWAKGDTNEITADGFLNWVFHRNTDGAIGFTDSAEGKKWQAFMNDSMEVWIRNAVVYNALRENSNIPFFVEHGMLPNFAGFTTLAESDVNVRTEPSTAKGDETVVRSLAKGEEVAVIGQTKGGFNGRDNSWTAIIWNGRKLWVASYLLVPTQNVPTPVREDDSHFDFDPSGSGEEEWEFFFRLASYLDQGVVNVQ